MSMFVRMTHTTRILLCIILAVCTADLAAQPTAAQPIAEQPTYEAGVVAGGTYNIHSARFSKLGTYPSCCPEFTDGSGLAWFAGAWFGWRLSPSMTLLGRLTASSESGLLSDQERSFVADLRDTAKVVNALFQHDLRASLLSIGIEPLLAFRVVGSLDLMIGARAGVVVTRRFQQTETLTEPADYGTFLGDDRVWVDTQADIPSAASLRLSAVAGVRYLLPMGPRKKSFLAPELMVHIPLTGVANGVQWNVTQIRLGIALGWSLVKDIDTVPPKPQQQPPPQASPPPVIAFTPPLVSTRLIGIDVDGSELPNQSVRVEQTQVTTLHPMLGHVYFDAVQSVLPDRYRNGIERAKRDTLRLLPREALHAELFIIAQRMVRNPRARLTLTGTTAGVGADQGPQLARARAQTVRDVLVELGVPDERIDVQSRNTPQKMTNASDTTESRLAIEENRRVEIVASSPDITAPLTLGSTDVDVSPSSYRIVSSIVSVLPITSASVELRHADRVLTRAARPRVPEDTIEVTLSDEDIAALSDGPIVASVIARDSIGQTSSAQATMRVEVSAVSKGRVENLGTTQIERYQLILFDFNDVTVSGANARLLAMIRSRITPATRVRIVGATDVMGSSEYNADLSLRRAREVARQLQVSDPEVVGSGEQDARFDNSLPEGRAYNRTVIVELINSAK